MSLWDRIKNGVKNGITSVTDWANENVIQPIGQGIETATDWVKDTAQDVGQWANENVIQPIGQGIETATDWVKTELTDPIKEDLQPAKDWVNNNVIQPIGQGIETAKDWTQGAVEDAKEWTQGAVEDVKDWTQGAVEDVKDWTQGAVEDTKEFISENTPKVGEYFQNLLKPKIGATATEIINGYTGLNLGQESTETPQGSAGNVESGTSENSDKWKDLEKIWAREDAIRKETQEREDSAYQRAVEDMRKAGINPNLVGINPASSGGGITSATRPEQVMGTEIASLTNQLLNGINNEVKISENQKDRLQSLISTILMGSMLKGKIKK